MRVRGGLLRSLFHLLFSLRCGLFFFFFAVHDTPTYILPYPCPGFLHLLCVHCAKGSIAESLGIGCPYDILRLDQLGFAPPSLPWLFPMPRRERGWLRIASG